MAVETTIAIDIPYIEETSRGSELTGTLAKESWKAQQLEEERRRETESAPSVFNIPLSILACLFCPIIGPLAVIFAFEARSVYKDGHYLEAQALSERARGTSFYSILIGIGLLVGMGVLLGVGDRFNWY